MFHGQVFFWKVLAMLFCCGAIVLSRIFNLYTIKMNFPNSARGRFYLLKCMALLCGNIIIYNAL